MCHFICFPTYFVTISYVFISLSNINCFFYKLNKHLSPFVYEHITDKVFLLLFFLKAEKYPEKINLHSSFLVSNFLWWRLLFRSLKLLTIQMVCQLSVLGCVCVCVCIHIAFSIMLFIWLLPRFSKNSWMEWQTVLSFVISRPFYCWIEV